MDLNAIFGSSTDFFNSDFGQMVLNFFSGVYQFLFPANAEGAWEVPLPDTMKP